MTSTSSAHAKSYGLKATQARIVFLIFHVGFAFFGSSSLSRKFRTCLQKIKKFRLNSQLSSARCSLLPQKRKKYWKTNLLCFSGGSRRIGSGISSSGSSRGGRSISRNSISTRVFGFSGRTLGFGHNFVNVLQWVGSKRRWGGWTKFEQWGRVVFVSYQRNLPNNQCKSKKNVKYRWNQGSKQESKSNQIIEWNSQVIKTRANWLFDLAKRNHIFNCETEFEKKDDFPSKIVRFI